MDNDVERSKTIIGYNCEMYCCVSRLKLLKELKLITDDEYKAIEKIAIYYYEAKIASV